MNWTDIKITFWMAAGNVKALVKTLNRWFTYARELLYWPVQQYNLDTAALFIIDMIAWERDIQRYNNEPEALYRARVKYAYQNARDAGTVAGFKAIWARCGLGEVDITERIEGEDWDIVQLWSDVQVIANNSELIKILIEKYGKTCRRYQLCSVTEFSASVAAITVGSNNQYINIVSSIDLKYLKNLPEFSILDKVSPILDNDYILIDESISDIPDGVLHENDSYLKEYDNFLNDSLKAIL